MRKIFFSLFLILFPTLLFSQYRRDFEQEIDLGISGGVDFSKVSFLHNMQNRMNQLGNQSFTPNYRFGVVCRYISQYHFGLQALKAQGCDGVCRVLPCGLPPFADFHFQSAKAEVCFAVRFLVSSQLLSYF